MINSVSMQQQIWWRNVFLGCEIEEDLQSTADEELTKRI
jgi:hypothetical protein